MIGVLIVQIRSALVVQLHTKRNTVDVMMVRIHSFCWRLLHQMTYGYGTLSLVLLANDVTYPSGYYLCDGIYPEWVTFFKSVSNLAEDDYKRLRYKRKHEAERKDVEWTFGVVKNK
ncbi:ALP1-like protein [Tanacetum coccineum]